MNIIATTYFANSAVNHKGLELENITVVLSRNDIGQLLEGVEILIEQWDATAEYLSTGRVQEDICIRESHDAREAESIAATYRSLRDQISGQMP